MIAHLLTQVPLFVWIILALVGIVAAYLRFGKNGAILAASAAALFLAFFAGRRTEQSNAKVEDQNHADSITDRADAARNRVDSIPADELRKPSPFQRD